MFSFFPQILIIVSLAVIIIILARKFPQASEFQEKNGKVEIDGFWGRVYSVIKYIGRYFKKFSISVFEKIYSKTKRAGNKSEEKDELNISTSGSNQASKETIKEDNKITKVIVDKGKIFDLLEEAAEKLGSGLYNEAEKIYIEIVSIDSKNIRAYKGLGKVYKALNNKEDAKSSYQQVLLIKPGDSEAKEELKKIQLDS